MSYSFGLSLLPQTQNAIHKYGIDGEHLNPKWKKEKNYLCVVDLFTGLAKHIELNPEYKVRKEKFAELLAPQDAKNIQQLVSSAATNMNILSSAQEATEGVDFYSNALPITNTVDLYFALKNNHTNKLITPKEWLNTNDPQLIILLSELIERGADICFGTLLPEMLATRTVIGKNFIEYLGDDSVPAWWEKAYFGSKGADTSRETLINLVRRQLTNHGLSKDHWDHYIPSAENYQLTGLLYKDPYYLGWLDPAAGDCTLETIDDLSAILSNPAKIRSLTFTKQYGFTTLPSKTCISLRELRFEYVRADLSTLSRFIHLEALSFGHFQKQRSLLGLPNLPKLKSLEISNGTLFQTDIEKICDQPQLEVLKLNECKLPNVLHLAPLLKLTKLKVLSLPKNIYCSQEQTTQETLALLADKGVNIDL